MATRMRYNLLQATLATDLLIGDTSIDFNTSLKEGGVDIPTLGVDEILALRIDQEIMHLTAYTSGANSGTVLRAQENTAEADHYSATAVRHVHTKEDVGEGGGAFAIRIAASNARAAEIAAADYVCTGTNDEAVFATAISDADAENANGIDLHLSTGTFFFDAEWNIPSTVSKVSVIGSASSTRDGSSTSIEKSTAGDFSYIDSSAPILVLENLTFYSGVAENITEAMLKLASGTRTALRRCNLYTWDSGTDAISIVNTAFLSLEECDISGDGTSCIKTTAGVNTVRATDCTFYASGGPAIDAQGQSASTSNGIQRGDWKFVGCEFSADATAVIRFDGAVGQRPRLFLTDCTLIATAADVDLVYGTEMTPMINGCRFDSSTAGSGLRLQTTSIGEIVGNVFDTIGKHGIWLLDANNTIVSGNTLKDYSNVADATYSGIILDGNTNDCLVIGNVLRSTATNKALYGIRIDDSTCDNNTVRDNALRSSAKTNGNEISDLGTGTSGQEMLLFALSDDTTAIAATGEKLSVRWPYAFVITKVRGSLRTASASGGPFTIDIEEGGVSIFTTDLLEVDDTELTSLTATQPNITDRYIADDAIVTFDVDDVGDGAATGAKVAVYGYRI